MLWNKKKNNGCISTKTLHSAIHFGCGCFGQNLENKSCFNRFCLMEGYDKEMEPAPNYTVFINPMVQEIYKVKLHSILV